MSFFFSVLILAACSMSFRPTSTARGIDTTSTDTTITTVDTGDTTDTTDTTEIYEDEGPNLITNGSFELGEGVYAGVGLGWETDDAQVHTEDYLDSEHGYSGTSQCINTNGSWGAGTILQKTNFGDVIEGNSYRLRTVIKASGNLNPSSNPLSVLWYQDSTYVKGTQLATQPSVNYDWVAVSIEAEAPTGANTAWIVLTGEFDGTVCYDNMNFAKLTGTDTGN